MLLVKYKNLDAVEFANKYNDKVKLLTPNKTDNASNWLIKFIEEVKRANSDNSIIITDYMKELILGFKALKLKYSIAYPQHISKAEYDENKLEYDALKIQAQEVETFVIKDGETIEKVLADKFDWISIKEENVEEENVVEDNGVVVADSKPVLQERKPLTFKELVENDDIEITDADIRDMKALTNKFKITMLLQAKSRLKTVLKLCDVLDKLYDELVNRIDVSLATTDTSSLMYTADYIAKALNDTNQFIMPLINNEKLQNFFIIDNSSVINISDSRVDINKREKIRKAAEIVLDNIDYFAEGNYGNIVNPNDTIIEIENNKNEE